jgi:hypothetical protein
MIISSLRLYPSFDVCQRTLEGLIHANSLWPNSVGKFSSEAFTIDTTTIVQQFAVCSVDHNACQGAESRPLLQHVEYTPRIRKASPPPILGCRDGQ